MILIKKLQELSALKHKPKQHHASFWNNVCFHRPADGDLL